MKYDDSDSNDENDDEPDNNEDSSISSQDDLDSDLESLTSCSGTCTPNALLMPPWHQPSLQQYEDELFQNFIFSEIINQLQNVEPSIVDIFNHVIDYLEFHNIHNPYNMNRVIKFGNALCNELGIQQSQYTIDRPMAILKLYCDDVDTLSTYKGRVYTHNEKLLTEYYGECGFDLVVPDAIECMADRVTFIDHHVKAVMYYNNFPTSYYVYPRPSIANTTLSLANSIGIIDSSYRGNLIAAVYSRGDNWHLIGGSRIVQICSPHLYPIFVRIVTTPADLWENARV